jgi:C4-dicarboxylate-binding protein DctP
LRTVADFKGMKFRVLATKIETGLMEKLGATGVPIPLEETLPALQNRLIDGIRSNIIVTAGLKYFSIAKFLTLVNDTQIATIGMISTAFLAKLPPDLKKAVIEVANEMSAVGYEKSVEFDARSAKIWRDNGAEVLEMVPAERAEFMRRGREVADAELKNNADPKTRELYALLTQTAERTRKK